MAMKWIILLSVASLVLGGDYKKKLSLAMECCNLNSAVPLFFNEPSENCGRSVKDRVAEGGTYIYTCVDDCRLIDHGLLNFTDVSIKAPELRELLLEMAPADATDVLGNAFDECFAHLKNGHLVEYAGNCPSGSADLFFCTAKYIATKCPDRLWSKERRRCKYTTGEKKNVSVGGNATRL